MDRAGPWVASLFWSFRTNTKITPTLIRGGNHLFTNSLLPHSRLGWPKNAAQAKIYGTGNNVSAVSRRQECSCISAGSKRLDWRKGRWTWQSLQVTEKAQIPGQQVERVFWAPRGGDNLKPRPLGNASVNQAPSGVWEEASCQLTFSPRCAKWRGRWILFIHQPIPSLPPSPLPFIPFFLHSFIFFLPSFSFTFGS